MKSPRPTAGFTLIELLTVLTIVALLATLSSVSLSGLLRSNSLSIAANLISGELSHARSAAVAHSCCTELRLITSTPTPCIQTVLLLNNGTTIALTRPEYFPPDVVLSPNTSYSGVASMTAQTVPSGLPNAGASYYAIRFSSTGAPRDASGNALTTANNYFTLVSSQYARNSQLPPNWITLTLDLRSGSIRRYQP